MLSLQLKTFQDFGFLCDVTHFRHPTDEQLRHIDIYFLATTINCSLSTLNVWFQKISIPPPPPTEDHWKFRGGGGVQRQ